jgi:hypothetical protein
MGIDPLLADVGDVPPTGYDSVIITTPTVLHTVHIEQFLPLGIPILCEKPITTSLRVLDRFMPKIEGAKVDMVNQYRFLRGRFDEVADGVTLYDYFNHGRDGLAWDCISVVALAKGHVALGERSPSWQCVINGERMSLSDMDQAYIDMISHWVNGQLVGHDSTYIRDAHAKVHAYIEANA